jgi:hypothetical protein
VTVIPVFLGQGGHVRRDLPELLEQLRQAHPGVEVRTVAAVGEDEAVLQAIAAYCMGKANADPAIGTTGTKMARQTGHLLLGEGLSPSEQAGAVGYGLVRLEEDDLALGIRKAQRQYFRHELADLARRKLTTAATWRPPAGPACSGW